MKVTASINFAKKSMDYKKLEAHNSRSYSQDKNKNIDPNLTPSNISSKLVDWHQIWLPRIAPYIKKKNRNAIAHGNYKRVKNPMNVLKNKYTSITRCGIITLGNSSFRKKLEDHITAVKSRPFDKSNQSQLIVVRRLENKLLINYAKEFNKRHKRIKIGKIVAHGDEKFIHAHAEFIAIPHNTKPSKRFPKGKPSFSFSRAIKQEYHAQNNKIGLKKFRHQEDRDIVNTYSKAMSANLILTRTHNPSKDDERQHARAVLYRKEAEKAQKKNQKMGMANIKEAINMYNLVTNNKQISAENSAISTRQSRMKSDIVSAGKSKANSVATTIIHSASSRASATNSSISTATSSLNKRESNLKSKENEFNHYHSRTRQSMIDTIGKLAPKQNINLDNYSDKKLTNTVISVAVNVANIIDKYKKMAKAKIKNFFNSKKSKKIKEIKLKSKEIEKDPFSQTPNMSRTRPKIKYKHNEKENENEKNNGPEI